ncbi:hypothetical protein ACFXP3_38130, partial [Streptomyces sp. NPDC059096]
MASRSRAMARRLPSPRLGSEEHAGPNGTATPGAVLGLLGDGEVEPELEVEGEVLGDAGSDGDAEDAGADGDMDSAADVEVSGDGVTARAWGACVPRVTGRAAAGGAGPGPAGAGGPARARGGGAPPHLW